MRDMGSCSRTTGLVIMASGLGKRFGSNKLMENVGGRPLIQWIIDATEDIFARRIVVTRSSDVRCLCEDIGIEYILHDCPNRNDTVRIGLSAIMSDIDYCFFVPADQPLISRKSIAKMVQEAKSYPDAIIRSSFGDVVGSPVGFPPDLFGELLKLPERKGGSWVASNNKELVRTVSVDSEYELWDIDTVDDLRRLEDVISKKNK